MRPSPRVLALLTMVAALAPAGLRADYDPKPFAAFAAAEGSWSGTLTYRDYSEPDRQVVLPTELRVALTGPDELVLHYTFDDGPGKVVHSYERMRLDRGAGTLTWSGLSASDTSICTLISLDLREDRCEMVAARQDPKGGGQAIIRYHVMLKADAIEIEREDGPSPDRLQFRDRSLFRRPKP